jgi:hypothetical protein
MSITGDGIAMFGIRGNEVVCVPPTFISFSVSFLPLKLQVETIFYA